MRIAVLSYPMLFQRDGGLQVQLRETVKSLNAIGVDARLFDTNTERLGDFDVVHVFGAINGNHRIVEAARRAGVPVVLSPVLHPPFSRRHATIAGLLDRVIGRLTGWQIETSFRQISAALHGADRVLALGRRELAMIAGSYGVAAEKLAIVPNGIAEHFFQSDPDAFRAHSAVTGNFVLSVGSISPYKNQYGLVDALAGSGLDIVLIGGCDSDQHTYLQRCLRRSEGRVHYIGSLAHDDPLLASAYAAARVFALPSRTEVAPLVVLEALAAGTPVVFTKNQSLDLPIDGMTLRLVNPQNRRAIKEAVCAAVDSTPDPAQCQRLVKNQQWNAVADRLTAIYAHLLDPPPPSG